MRRRVEARALLLCERDRGERELGLAVGEAAAQVRATRLMRGAISRDHQRQSEGQSGAIRGSSEAHQRPIRGPSVDISGELAFISIASISRPPTPRFLTPSVNASKVAKAEKGPHSPRRSM